MQDSVVRFGVIDQWVILGPVEELECARILLVTRGELALIPEKDMYMFTTYIHCFRGGMIACDVKVD